MKRGGEVKEEEVHTYLSSPPEEEEGRVEDVEEEEGEDDI